MKLISELKYMIAIVVLLATTAFSQTSKTLKNRAVDQDLTMCVTPSGGEKCPAILNGITGKFEIFNDTVVNPVGTVFYESGTQATVTEDNTPYNLTSVITLTKGTWIVSASALFASSTGAVLQFRLAIDNSSATQSGGVTPNTSTGEVVISAISSGSGIAASSLSVHTTGYPVIVPSGTLDLYLNGSINTSVTNATGYGWISVVRIK